ncbi:MAG: flagellar motor protein MotB [Acidobacteriaceae bacterium]
MSRKKKHDHVNHERWLVSYADFITLLFAFFVVLFASSQSDKRKVQQVEHSIHSAFETMGIFPEMNTVPNLASIAADAAPAAGVADDDMDLSAKQLADLNRMKQRMERLLAIEIAHHTVDIRMGRDGLIISLREAGFFESASADPLPTSMNTLYAIARALAETPYDVRIEGNTDNVPIHNNRFDSNWELSTARATVLARIFIVNAHIAPIRISAAGYAEFHPVASNATEAGRSRNRRVDIIVLPSSHRSSMMKTAAATPHSSHINPPAEERFSTIYRVESAPTLTARREFAPILKVLRSDPPPSVQPRD